MCVSLGSCEVEATPEDCPERRTIEERLSPRIVTAFSHQSQIYSKIYFLKPYIEPRGRFDVDVTGLIVEWIPVEEVVTLELLRVEPLVLDVIVSPREDVFVLSVLLVTQLPGAIPHHLQHRLGVNDVLHLLVGVVEYEEREPYLLGLRRSHPVGVRGRAEIVVLQPTVRPLESHRELGLVGGVHGVEGGESVEPQTGEDGQARLAEQILGPGDRRGEIFVVARVELYYSAVDLVSEVFTVRLAITPERRRPCLLVPPI